MLIPLEISGHYMMRKREHRSAHTHHHKGYKNRRLGFLKEPFSNSGTPAFVLKNMVALRENAQTVSLKIDLIFTAADSGQYEALNKTELKKGCKVNEEYAQLLELLSLDFRFLLACDEAAN